MPIPEGVFCADGIPTKSGGKMTPYYESKLGKLYHGDCLDIMPQLDPVDLVITDIPYDEVNRDDNGLRNLNKKDADVLCFDLPIFLEQCVKITRGCFYTFCGTEQVSRIRETLVDMGLSTRLGFWEKTNPSPMNGQHIWLSGVECFVYGKKKNGVHNANCKNPVFKNVVARNQIHPTQKPFGVIQQIVLASSNPNQDVLDPCFGSGTLGVVCEKNNRRWIGIEISEKYCEIAAKRIESEASQLKLW